MSNVSLALKLIGGAVIGSVAVGTVYASLRFGARKSMKREGAEERDFYDVLFFPDSKVACAAQATALRGCSNPRCTFSHDPKLSFARLLKYLTSTRHTLDLCVFIITCQDLADVIIELYKRGVQVRVISDREQMNAMGSQVARFLAEGIQVRFGKESYLMHHKFAVVDQWLLINGSFNWTRQAIAGNNENVFITDSSQIVASYQSEFERLWSQFDPKK